MCVCSDKKKKDSLSAMDVMEAANTDSAVELDSLKLMEVNTQFNYKISDGSVVLLSAVVDYDDKYDCGVLHIMKGWKRGVSSREGEMWAESGKSCFSGRRKQFRLLGGHDCRRTCY